MRGWVSELCDACDGGIDEKGWSESSSDENDIIASPTMRALVSVVIEAKLTAGIDEEAAADNDARQILLALTFTTGLNDSYNTYKQYHDSVREWPLTLSDAFHEASKFVPRRGDRAGDHLTGGQVNAFTMRRI